MSNPPLNVFSGTCDPPGVLEALRAHASSVVIVERDSAGDWRRARAQCGGAVLEVMHDPEYYGGPDWPRQLRGMIAYFARFPETPHKRAVLRALRSLRFALAFPDAAAALDDDEDPRLEMVLAICRRLDGVIFTPGGLLDARARTLIDHAGSWDPDAALPAEAPEHPSFAPTHGDSPLPPPPPRRAANLAVLERLGFRVARGLPWNDPNEEKLRPLDEIARRLMAQDALFTWVSQDSVSADRVRAYVERGQLRQALTPEEQALLDLPREQAGEHRHAIGWRLENMWPLAWALGFEPEPTVDGGMIDGAITRAMLLEFLPGLDAAVADLLAKAKPRSLEEIAEREDLFYCAHNAVRSAQLGEDTVPDGFDPVADGGVVHERRHALTWMLSPGIGWDETDLST